MIAVRSGLRVLHPFFERDHWRQRPRFRRKLYCREKKQYRKAHTRQYRSKVREAMHHAWKRNDWEHIPRFRRDGRMAHLVGKVV